MKHYYIEDISVDPMRVDRITPVRSVQINELPMLSEEKGEAMVQINAECQNWMNSSDGMISIGVVIPLKELKNAIEVLETK